MLSVTVKLDGAPGVAPGNPEATELAPTVVEAVVHVEILT